MRGTLIASVAVVVVVGLSYNEPALAAGGAHVVDDSEVETPGSCHLETWVTRRGGSAGDAVINPACTPMLLPNLEIGAGSSYSWDHGSDALAFGPAVKWNLRPLSTGLGLAIGASATWSSMDHRIEMASFVVPASLQIASRITVNANGGIEWSRSAANVGAFFGAQVVWQETSSFGIMTEAFARTQGSSGTQVGIRWNPDPNIDVDVLLSHAFAGPNQETATVGITRRFR